MQAIKCRTCGERHWGRVCPGSGIEQLDLKLVKPDEVKTAVEPRRRKSPKAVETPAKQPISSDKLLKRGRKNDPAFIDPETGLYSERLYKREYMRKRRENVK